jgi:hypothetical protein
MRGDAAQRKQEAQRRGSPRLSAFARGGQRAGRKRGFATFDLLFCAIPLLLMLSFLLHQAWIVRESAHSQIDSSQAYGKLLSIADYAVKRGGAIRENQAGGQFSGSALYRPNMVEDAELSKIPVEEIKGWMGLDSLSIGWDKGEGTCVYRIVLHEDEVEKLYVCGE